ncbi:MAG: MoxR family ATPase [Oligoflexales bacterium]|nr:MoxR family ATPase [Oligoflexales bacterium]
MVEASLEANGLVKGADVSTESWEPRMREASGRIEQALAEISKKVIGQPRVGQRLLMALVAGGHVLLEGMPGLAKTTSIKALAEVCQLHFKRIQFTPDLLPADLIGTQIYDPRSAEFKVKKGPIFAHLVLADEINRAPAKVQSALLEAMEEKQVTLGEQTYPLEDPFLVLATQNPIEQEGTYQLPEAQIDRFLMKLKISYSSPQDEEEIIRRSSLEQMTVDKLLDRHAIRDMRNLVQKVYVSEKIRRYIVDLVFATRTPKERGFPDLAPLIEYGASPRASIALDKLSRVNAFFEGRSFVTPQDVKDVGMDALRHRVKLTYEAEADAVGPEQVISRIFDKVDVP